MPVIALVIGLAGLAAIVAGWLLLSRLGPRFRVGRLLAAAPQVSLTEALALATAGEPRYVRVHGRISSDEEFPDEHDRPLVYRRRRLLVAAQGGGWTVVGDEREAVPFGIEERGSYLAVDAAVLDEGLVVVTRESDGRVADLPGELADELPAQAAGRLLIEQVSAVEHAFACGVPARAPDGGTMLTEGLGRPLILTTLEPAAAMRILARNARRRVALATVLIGLGIAGVLLAPLVLLLG